jgi:hypothetical protein
MPSEIASEMLSEMSEPSEKVPAKASESVRFPQESDGSDASDRKKTRSEVISTHTSYP